MTEQPDYAAIRAHYDTEIAHMEQRLSVMRDRLATIMALEQHAVSPSEASEFPEVGDYTFLHRKGLTGAMERRTVHIATPRVSPGSAFWPDAAPVEDIRIDPPYDR